VTAKDWKAIGQQVQTLAVKAQRVTARETPKAPFPWFGGKARAASLIWERFGGDVPNYVEPFAGSLAVLLGRPGVKVGTETVNDKDAHLANFWRAVQHDPEGVAAYADWPVNENDLTARHIWLVNEGAARVARLEGDPDYYDVQSAGWWVWGICSWIGSGWCSGNGPWGADEEGKLAHLGDRGKGVNRQLAHLGDRGQGVNRQLAHLGNRGQAIAEWFAALSERLRDVRVISGDWTRIMTETITERLGATAVLLDPPYEGLEDYYAEGPAVAGAVREWAIANGDNPKLRIALCGYEGIAMPAEWDCVPWKAHGGYSSMDGENQNAHNERIWFSPACLKPDRPRTMAFEWPA